MILLLFLPTTVITFILPNGTNLTPLADFPDFNEPIWAGKSTNMNYGVENGCSSGSCNGGGCQPPPKDVPRCSCPCPQAQNQEPKRFSSYGNGLANSQHSMSNLPDDGFNRFGNQQQNFEFEFQPPQARSMAAGPARTNPQHYGNNNFGNRGSYGNQAPLGYSYAGYIHRQARRYPIMMYTLVQCVPCQRAKHLLAVSYSDIAAHFLELVGDEDWQRQLQVDLQRITGQVTFPYIFICGQHIGGSSDLFSLHHNGQLRTMLNNCSR